MKTLLSSSLLVFFFFTLFNLRGFNRNWPYFVDLVLNFSFFLSQETIVSQENN